MKRVTKTAGRALLGGAGAWGCDRRVGRGANRSGPGSGNQAVVPRTVNSDQASATLVSPVLPSVFASLRLCVSFFPFTRTLRRGPAVLAAVALALAGCGGGGEPAARPAPAVSTAPVQIRRVELTLPLLGKAESARTVALRALVEGRVVAVRVADGARVEPGMVIFEIGGSRVQARRRALEAEVATAKRSVEAATKRLEQARRRRESHLAAPGEVTRAALELATEQAGLATARAALERFDASVAVAAPASGRFAGRRVSRGQVVRPGDVLGEILEPGSIRVEAQVMPRPGLDPAEGQRARIDAAGGPLEATVTAIQPMAGGAGTVQVWLTGDALRGLAPGTAVRGRLVVAVHEKAVTVPRAAVVRDNRDRPLVYVVSGGKYERRPVTTGEEGPDWIEITSGLEPGESVVTEGAYELYWAEFG
ncbi:MAG TPA: efflux RND transporter periplasmic adaptor subunit, partial [Acidobacteria bacterium]|nr:efflux RND transporter periplasmic adaptor subunit [Acidobacteriota bacterium]